MTQALDEKIVRLPLDRLTLLAETWPRQGPDHSRIREFMTLYEDGGLTALPPLWGITDRDQAVLSEGRHRYLALLALGFEEALVRLMPLPAGRELVEFAFEQALEASAVATLPLTRTETRSASQRLLTTRPDYSDREIARLTGLSHQTVGRMRARSNGPESEQRDSEDTATVYYIEVTANEIASRLVRGMRQMWEKRGLGDRIVGDRAGKRLAAALLTAHGDDALAWAERFTAWGRVAVAELKRAGA